MRIQSLALVNERSVYHNMFLKRELLRNPLFLLDNKRVHAGTAAPGEDGRQHPLRFPHAIPI